MKEKSDYQHMISRSVGTKVVGVCASKQNYAAIRGKACPEYSKIKIMNQNNPQNNKHTLNNKNNPQTKTKSPEVNHK